MSDDVTRPAAPSWIRVRNAVGLSVIVAAIAIGLIHLPGHDRPFGGALVVGGLTLMSALLTFAGPAAWARRCGRTPRFWRELGLRIIATPVAILFPLFIYLLSPLALNPSGKDEAPLGWLSLIPWLDWFWLPFVAWACVAFYVGVVLGRAAHARWISMGLLAGVIASGFLTTVLAIHVVTGKLPNRLSSSHMLWSLVPLGTLLVHAAAFRWSVRSRPLSSSQVLSLAGGAVVIGAVNVAKAVAAFHALPDHNTDCYVVTAATRGHGDVVRPLHDAWRHGERISVNRQLLVFWEFERRLSEKAPRFHARARHIYDLIGPRLARRLTTPLRADMAYLALKPGEWAAALLLWLGKGGERRVMEARWGRVRSVMSDRHPRMSSDDEVQRLVHRGAGGRCGPARK